MYMWQMNLSKKELVHKLSFPKDNLSRYNIYKNQYVETLTCPKINLYKNKLVQKWTFSKMKSSEIESVQKFKYQKINPIKNKPLPKLTCPFVFNIHVQKTSGPQINLSKI